MYTAQSKYFVILELIYVFSQVTMKKHNVLYVNVKYKKEKTWFYFFSDSSTVSVSFLFLPLRVSLQMKSIPTA